MVMTVQNFLWLAVGVVLVLFGWFVKSPSFDTLTDKYLWWILMAVGAVIIVATAGYMVYLVKKGKQ